jgi:transcription antitermination factor NusG
MRWFVAKHQPGKRTVALDHLDRQGFETYSPCGKFERVIAGKLRCESKPVFDGYLFIRIAFDNAQWRAINGTRGIVCLLNREQPIAVPVGEVERFIEAERQGKLIISEIRRIRRGDFVRFKNGPLVDQVCRCERTQGERVHLLLNLLGGISRVSVPAHTLAIVERAPVR